jgi:hypothetical protein
MVDCCFSYAGRISNVHSAFSRDENGWKSPNQQAVFEIIFEHTGIYFAKNTLVVQ